MYIYSTEEYEQVTGEVVLNIFRELGAPPATTLVAALLAPGGNPET